MNLLNRIHSLVYSCGIPVCLCFVLVNLGLFSIANSQENFLTIEGRVLYNPKKYPDERARVTIAQDGNVLKSLEAKGDGSFTTGISFNHVYVISLSMDYHGTSKVLVDTRVPEAVSKNPAGGIIEFACDLFELYEGLNMGILKKPLMRVSFNQRKNRFEFDKEYSENIRYEMEGFLVKLDELKMMDGKVLKSRELSSTSPLDEEKKERKVIEFEVEKEKKEVVNVRGTKNVMDLLAADEDPVLNKSQEVAKEEKFEDKEDIDVMNEEENKIASIDEVIIDKSLVIVPQRRTIDNSQNEINEKMEEKTGIMAVQDATRVRQEDMMREKVTEYNRLMTEQKEGVMAGRRAQAEMFKSLIETVAGAELYLKKDYYSRNPLQHKVIMPEIEVRTVESILLDEEKITISYPNGSKVFRKETYPFGFIYYYMGNTETDEENYCRTLNTYSKNKLSCTN